MESVHISHRLLLSVISFSIIISCSGRDSSRVRESVDPDGVRVVENGAIPQEWRKRMPVLQLEDLTVIGEGKEGDEYMLSFQPTGRWLAMGPGGQVGYPERQPAELRVYEPDGRCLWRAGRSGDGPGEFRTPIDLNYVDKLGWVVRDPWLHRLTIFDKSGNLAGIRSLECTMYAQYIRRMLFTENGDFWFLGQRTRPKDDGQYTTYYVSWVPWNDLTAAVVDSFMHPMLTPAGRDQHIHELWPVNLEVDRWGRAWVNGKLSYEIEVYEPEGGEHWRIRREYELTDYPKAFREYEESQTMAESPEGNWYIKLPPVQPAIAGMSWTGNDEMWVFTSAYIDSPLVQVDVFDDEGIYRRTFLADRRLRNVPIGPGFLYRTDVAEDGSPLLVHSGYRIVVR